jgi:hypothetical protein
MIYIAGTGTRDAQCYPLDEKMRLAIILRDRLLHWSKIDEVTVISGMAEGFDAALAHVALRLDIPLHCYVPGRGYGKHYWGENSKIIGKDRLYAFDHLLRKADHVEYTDEALSAKGSLYINGVHMNFLRNQRMVDKADVLFAWAENSVEASRGTQDCIKRALLKAGNGSKIEIEYLKRFISSVS